MFQNEEQDQPKNEVPTTLTDSLPEMRGGADAVAQTSNLVDGLPLPNEVVKAWVAERAAWTGVDVVEVIDAADDDRLLQEAAQASTSSSSGAGAWRVVLAAAGALALMVMIATAVLVRLRGDRQDA